MATPPVGSLGAHVCSCNSLSLAYGSCLPPSWPETLAGGAQWPRARRNGPGLAQGSGRVAKFSRPPWAAQFHCTADLSQPAGAILAQKIESQRAAYVVAAGPPAAAALPRVMRPSRRLLRASTPRQTVPPWPGRRPLATLPTASAAATAAAHDRAADGPVVVTTQRLDISTGWRDDERVPGSSPRRMPLATTDVHVLHEQLPFGYFFRETLAADELAASLEWVLAAFPVLGGQLCLDSLTVQLSEDDTVPLTIGHTSTPMEEWLGLGHGVDALTGRPQLLPIFDALPEKPWSSRTPLAAVRVTFMCAKH